MKLLKFAMLVILTALFSQCKPDVEVDLVPEEGGVVKYQEMAPIAKGGATTAQLSLLAWMKNNEQDALLLEKVNIITGGNTHSWTVAPDTDADKPNPIPANGKSFWHNGRDYNVLGDVIILAKPYPPSMSMELYFKDYNQPVVIDRSMRAYTGAPLQFPARPEHLDINEYWSGWSRHGSGGAQVFGLDILVRGWDGNNWNNLLPNTTGKKNQDYRCYGKPIYAMADGVVLSSRNDHPENPNPPAKNYQDVEGNHFWIQHGDVNVLYAHFQKGSLNKDLLKNGSTVSKGDFLGLTGNSGNSTEPHLHIHALKANGLERDYRPMRLYDADVVGTSIMTHPGITDQWEPLGNRTLPTDQVLISPYASLNWPEYTRFGLWEDYYQGEFNKITKAGYYPEWVNGYEAGGNGYFNVIFRPAQGIKWVAKHGLTGNEYQNEVNHWTGQGYRLIHVDSYIRNGEVRYAAVFREMPGPTVKAYHGKNLNDHEQLFNDCKNNGFVPTHISVVVVDNQEYFTAIYEQKNVNGFHHFADLSANQYQSKFNELDQQGYKPVYIDTYKKGNATKFSVIWYANPPFTDIAAVHGNNGNQFQQAFDEKLANGYLSRCITAYEDGQQVSFAGLWTK